MGIYFLLGLWHLSPSVDFGDAGEFAAASATLSLPHPPAFPLYCLAGKAFGSLVPLGSWAYRMNLFSLACTAGALGLLWRAARHSGFSPAACLLGAAVFAVLPGTLHEALVTEVFALHLLWAAAGLYHMSVTSITASP